MSDLMDVDNPQRRLLLDLPAELRNDIYEMLLSSEEPVDLSKHVPQPSLTRVCRQVQQESMAWYYTRNTFAITLCNGNLSDFIDFACRTPTEGLWLIRDWGRLRISTKYTSIFDMPLSQSAVEWRQPFTKTTEPAIDFLFEQHMRRDDSTISKEEETGRELLDWVLQSETLDKLRQERRMGPTFSDMVSLKMRTDGQLQSIGYNLC